MSEEYLAAQETAERWTQPDTAALVEELRMHADDCPRCSAALTALQSRVEELERALVSLESEGWFAAWSEDPRVKVIRAALDHAPESRPDERDRDDLSRDCQTGC